MRPPCECAACRPSARRRRINGVCADAVVASQPADMQGPAQSRVRVTSGRLAGAKRPAAQYMHALCGFAGTQVCGSYEGCCARPPRRRRPGPGSGRAMPPGEGPLRRVGAVLPLPRPPGWCSRALASPVHLRRANWGPPSGARERSAAPVGAATVAVRSSVMRGCAASALGLSAAPLAQDLTFMSFEQLPCASPRERGPGKDAGGTPAEEECHGRS